MLHTVLLQALLFWLSGVATILTSSLGVVGNLLSLAVLSKKVVSNRRSGGGESRYVMQIMSIELIKITLHK